MGYEMVSLGMVTRSKFDAPGCLVQPFVLDLAASPLTFKLVLTNLSTRRGGTNPLATGAETLKGFDRVRMVRDLLKFS